MLAARTTTPHAAWTPAALRKETRAPLGRAAGVPSFHVFPCLAIPRDCSLVWGLYVRLVGGVLYVHGFGCSVGGEGFGGFVGEVAEGSGAFGVCEAGVGGGTVGSRA